MKIAVCSDLHLEFGDLHLKNTEGADVLILGGDILVAPILKYLDPILRDADTAPSLVGEAERYYTFVENCCKEFKVVLYIAGNHEHYNGDFGETLPLIRKHLKFENLIILDKESIRIDDTIFFGGTLWTDMNSGDPYTINRVQLSMNDFRIVTNKQVGENCWFLPQDAIEDHKQFLAKLKTCLSLNPETKFVVVGHHAPTKESVKPKYKKEHHMNGAYSSDLVQFILDHRNIKLWTHGHTHDDFDYMVGTTRVVCNPRGYDGYEDRADNFKLKYVEV
jgi:predicted phosphodiesterase